MKLTTKTTLSAITLTAMALMPLSANAEEVAPVTTEANTAGIEAVTTTEAPTQFTKAPVAVETTDTSVKLEWEALEGAALYVLYYDTESKADSTEEFVTYANESEDVILENKYEVTGLEAGKTYYFMVEAYDDNSELLGESPEATVELVSEEKVTEEATTEEVAAEKLAIELASASYLNEVKVTLNKEIDVDAERLFKVSDLNGEELPVAESYVDGKTVTIVLDAEMQTTTEYELTAISLTDVDGAVIEEGVSGTFTFVTPETLEPRQLNSAPEEPEEKVIEETTTPEEPKEEPKKEEPKEEPTVEIEDVKTLPETGAEEMLVLMLAVLLAGYAMQRRKA